jgi:hypothetical protein
VQGIADVADDTAQDKDKVNATGCSAGVSVGGRDSHTLLRTRPAEHHE